MIQEYIHDLASQMGIKLSQVSIVDGQPLGYLDVYFLKMSSGGCMADALLYKGELEYIKN
jgi:hypothetical protein